ncbi:MAG: COX15/CtaA family protein [Candidatus Xenobia bacterium]
MSVQLEERPSGPRPSGLHRYACFVAGWTFLTIIAGSLVTSTGSSLSVPDWPLSFGKIMPPMVGGVFFEHGHRMIAATAGTLMIVLALWVGMRERRPWVRGLGYAALGAVCAQGLLGGLTVLLRLPPAVSIGHAALAQLTFCITVTLAVVTAGAWLRSSSRLQDALLPGLATLTTVLLYVQILIGAVVRHTEAGLAIPTFPLCFGDLMPSGDMWTGAVALQFSHTRIGATLVTVAIVAVLWRIVSRHRSRRELMVPAVVLACVLVGQILLGASIIWTGRMVAATSAHVAGGALLLGTSLVLTLQAWRLRLMQPASPQPTLTPAATERSLTGVSA